MERNKLWNNIISQCYGIKMQYNLGIMVWKKDGSHMLESFLSLRDVADTSTLLERLTFKWSLNNGELV